MFKQNNVTAIADMINDGLSAPFIEAVLEDARRYVTTDIVRLLMDLGVAIDTGHLLINASMLGKADVVGLLIERGVNIDMYGVRALSSAIYGDWIDVAKILVDAGVNVHSHKITNAVIRAVNCDKNIAKFMIEQGAEVDNMMIIDAIDHGNVDIIRCLASKGVDLAYTLQRPVIAMNVKIVDVLLQCGVIPDECDWEFVKPKDDSIFNDEGLKLLDEITDLFVYHGYIVDWVNPYKYLGILDHRHLPQLGDEHVTLKRVIMYRQGMGKRMMRYPSDIIMVC